MDDLDRYVAERSGRDPEFAEGFEEGYAEFRREVLLRQASGEVGISSPT